MSNNNPESNSKSEDKASLSWKNSQIGQIKESGSRIRVVDPKDTTFERYDGDPPAQR
ncbi:hypothetical protein [Crocosphaera chwakensis]|uniref:Peptide chain release factor 3 n=1 Tax=Crocosphaera chwakensis CCY0110 TaxID=391612 RepID=A3ISA0_9CHRO|nr:hypothetical protein [Crocosphaera chwakensis]EAZ90616.1 peptide chain release factor 3 [Crocosphaera chwakensis CCY0110]